VVLAAACEEAEAADSEAEVGATLAESVVAAEAVVATMVEVAVPEAVPVTKLVSVSSRTCIWDGKRTDRLVSPTRENAIVSNSPRRCR